MMTFPLAAIPEPGRASCTPRWRARTFRSRFGLPFHYADCRDQVWPVIYVLDANLYCGMAVDMVRAP